MNRYTSKFFALIILSILLTSCGKMENIQTPNSVIEQNTPITSISPTASPTSESLPTITPYPTTLADATAQAFNFVLCNNKPISWWDISPNGKWLAAPCIDENGTGQSPLFISNIDNSQHWKIYYSNYIFGSDIEKIGLSLDKHDEVIPQYWSKDGRFLFATVHSRFEGCCWIGGRYVLLVRLNLETGEQIALLRTDYYSANSFDFIISDEDRYLLFSPPSKQPYDFAILDFQTWETQQVVLKFRKDIDVAQARISPDASRVILPLFKQLELNDFYVNSIALVDLITGKQNVLVSDLTPENELFPVRWLDNTHVLLSNKNPVYDVSKKKEIHWLLEINSGQLEKETP